MPWVSQNASWITDISPGPGVTPSMVVMAEPSRLHGKHQAGAHRDAVEQHGAGAADAVLAAGMRAGQRQLVAQAIEQRGARLDVERAVFAVDVEFNAHALFPLRTLRRASATARAARLIATRRRYAAEACRSASASMPASASVTAAFTAAGSSAPPVSLLLGAVEPQRKIGHRADADGDAFAFAVVAKLDLRRRRHEGEVAAPRIHLVKADADLFTPPNRKAHAGQHRAGRQRRDHRPDEEIARRDLAVLPPARYVSVASSVMAISGSSAAGSALASEPPMVPRARVAAWPIQGNGARQQRQMHGDQRIGARPRIAAWWRRSQGRRRLGRFLGGYRTKRRCG